MDPGHGGIDPGAKSFSGKLEKDLNLKVALELEKFLKSAGAKVFITRRKDVDTNFRQIAAMSNNLGADVFVGIHYNSFRSPKISGTETYYYTGQSKKLAETLHHSMLKELKRKNRGTKKEMIYVLHHTKIPAVIVEPLYITNAKEDQLAQSQHFQRKIAYAILKGLKDYFRK
ncbi:MAG: N-acetylmuramoyl-L-alanine amidase [bacterium]